MGLKINVYRHVPPNLGICCPPNPGPSLCLMLVHNNRDIHVFVYCPLYKPHSVKYMLSEVKKDQIKFTSLLLSLFSLERLVYYFPQSMEQNSWNIMFRLKTLDSRLIAQHKQPWQIDFVVFDWKLKIVQRRVKIPMSFAPLSEISPRSTWWLMKICS